LVPSHIAERGFCCLQDYTLNDLQHNNNNNNKIQEKTYSTAEQPDKLYSRKSYIKSVGGAAGKI